MCMFAWQREKCSAARLIAIVSAALVLPAAAMTQTPCNWTWVDLGLNTHLNDTHFGTANGAHFATDGTDLYLLEGNNGVSFDWFNPATSRYEPRAALPEGDQDGGDLQYGAGVYYGAPGVGFDTSTGDGKGSRLYAYDVGTDTWSSAARCLIDGFYYAHEALAFDPVGQRLYATILNFQVGGDLDSRNKLAIYDPSSDTWIGFTSFAPDGWNGGSEAEYLGGAVYVWRGGFSGATADGASSYLDVYDIGTDTWTRTPSLADSGLSPGWRSGAFDVWGVSLAADAAEGKLFLMGGENNRQLYVFDVASQTWTLGPDAIYDGGWGASIEFVTASQTLYQIDGRNGTASPQGTAAMTIAPKPGDMNCDCGVNFDDINPFVSALVSQTAYEAAYPNCRWLNADINGDQRVTFDDINPFVACLVNAGCP